jgi:hypothetical protein
MKFQNHISKNASVLNEKPLAEWKLRKTEGRSSHLSLTLTNSCPI